MTESTKRRTSTNGRGALSDINDSAQRAASQLLEGAERMPEVIVNTGHQLQDAQAELERWPDRSLTVGASFCFGLAAGLFVSGSPRPLVLLAVAPGVAMVATLLGRGQAGPRSGDQQTSPRTRRAATS